MSHVGGRKFLRSPEEQAAEIEAWARTHGHRVEMLEPELDAKGGDPERVRLREAAAGVRSGRYSGVVVAYQSRAGRDMRLMLDLWDEIESAGGVFYSARENIDGSTAAGRLHRNLLASIHQHELEERREGFEKQREYATAEGIWQRRQTPLGYRKGEDRRLEPDRPEVVQAAFRDVLAGVSVVKIADRLGMTANGLRYLLRNRVYLGELRVGRHVNPDAHPAIIDRESFEAVQQRLAGHVRPPRRSEGPALLAGLCRCASCGHLMTRSRSGSARTYGCPTYHSGQRCPAPTSIAAHRIDPYVEAIAEQELAKLSAERATGDRLGELRQTTQAARAELSAYLAAVDAAGLGPEAAEGMRIRREAVAEAEAAEQAEMARAPMLPQIRSGVEEYRRQDAHGRNTLLRHLLAAVIVRPAGRGRKVPVPDRVRVLRYGADVTLASGRRGERAAGIVPIWPDVDGDDVLRLLSGE